MCFQETHTTDNIERNIQIEANYEFLYTHNSSNVGGLMIGFNRSLDYKIISRVSKLLECNSHIFIVHCNIQDTEFVIANCYVHPSDDMGNTIANLMEELAAFNNFHTIICGDFNASLDPHSRSSSYFKSRCSNLSEFVHKSEAVDVWKLMNPEQSHFTYYSKVQKSHRRLDYIFVNEGLVNSIEDSSIGVAYVTDHCPVHLTLNLSRNPPGKNYWKFPNFLTKNEQYIKFLEERIKVISELNVSSDPGLLWDTIKCDIRLSTMDFLKSERNVTKELIELIESTMAELCNLRMRSIDFEQMDCITDDLDSLSEQLNVLYAPSSTAIGRKALQNESSSKYFLSKAAIPGSISMLYNDRDEEVRDDSGINKICHAFYSKLYSQPPSVSLNDRDQPYCFIPPDNYSRKLKEDQIQVLEAEITKSELFDALEKMKTGSAPGLDGLSVEFYLTFWNSVGEFVYCSLQFAHNCGRFSISQKRGVIKLLPKKGKNPHFIKNLRPITLLSVDLKILTKLFALRFKLLLQDIVLPDQNAFIHKRYIGNNILDLYSLIEAAEENNEEAMIILLDIEKAFDTVNWDFLKSIFIRSGFPPYFIKWLDTLQNGKELHIFTNGHASEVLYPKRGVAQGCCLSPSSLFMPWKCWRMWLEITHKLVEFVVLNSKRKFPWLLTILYYVLWQGKIQWRKLIRC